MAESELPLDDIKIECYQVSQVKQNFQKNMSSSMSPTVVEQLCSGRIWGLGEARFIR